MSVQVCCALGESTVVLARIRSKSSMAASPEGRAIRVAAAMAAFFVLGWTAVAHAQVANLPPSQQSSAGWTIAITPYAWLPTISTTFSVTGPQGVTVTNTMELHNTTLMVMTGS